MQKKVEVLCKVLAKQKSHAWTTQDDSGLHALLKPDSKNIKGLLDGLSWLIRFHGLKADPGVTHVFRVNEGKDNVIMDFDGDTEKSIVMMVVGAKKIVEIHSVDGQKRQAKQATCCIFHVLKLCDTLIVPKNSRGFIYLLFVEYEGNLVVQPRAKEVTEQAGSRYLQRIERKLDLLLDGFNIDH